MKRRHSSRSAIVKDAATAGAGAGAGGGGGGRGRGRRGGGELASAVAISERGGGAGAGAGAGSGAGAGAGASADEDSLTSSTNTPSAWLQSVLIFSRQQPSTSRSILLCAAQLANFSAAKRLLAITQQPTTASGGATDVAGATASAQELMAATTAFSVAQLKRQSASLESNTRKALTSAAGDAVVRAHESALALILTPPLPARSSRSSSSVLKSLTVSDLTEVHTRILSGGVGVGGGALRSGGVHVGTTHFCAAPLVRPELVTTLSQLALFAAEGAEPFDHAAALVLGINNVHPFSDGNGRLARIYANWALQQAGVPFLVTLGSTPAARLEYIAALRSSREQRSLTPLANYIATHTALAWAELERVSAARARAASASAADAAVSAARAALRAEACMICLDEDPNVATLCCGAPVHLNCFSTWLATGDTASCIKCRVVLPRPPPRPAAPGGGGGGGRQGGLVAEEEETIEDSSETADPLLQGNSEDDEDSTSTSAVDNADSTSTSAVDSADTTSIVSPPPAPSTAAPYVPPPRYRCNYNTTGCRNIAANDCQHRACGACCVNYGPYRCQRHQAGAGSRASRSTGSSGSSSSY
jgi:fido (protein-threonine AMPylation protein)